MTEQVKQLPYRPQSYWLRSVSLPDFTPLSKSERTQVVVVGGGITGIMAAYMLAVQGAGVILIEADRLLHGTTGHTTAKLTAQHGLLYDELIHHMGVKKAQAYYKANADALAYVADLVTHDAIDCDFSFEDAYIYAQSDKTSAQVETEYRAYEKLGIDGSLCNELPVPISVKSAIMMKKQAQFHPLRFLAHIVKASVKRGVQVYEHTVAVDLEKGDSLTVVTSLGHKITADDVLICSHFPFYDRPGWYFTRMQAERSYIIAAKCQKEYKGGMYLSADTPVRSLRSVQNGDDRLVLIGGESHKTGQGKDTLLHYKALEEFAKEVLGVTDIMYRWSNQDLTTLDKVPYIGQLAAGYDHVYTATGYRKWGMTTGVAAAKLLTDLVFAKDNPYMELYQPSRFYMDPSLRRFLGQNANVAAHLIAGKLEAPIRDAFALDYDEGDVVTYKGVRAGAYRDESGDLHIVDTTCTHLGCEVQWNHGDRTWDCPCHGSRFSFRGDVVEGPAKKPLPQLLSP